MGAQARNRNTLVVWPGECPHLAVKKIENEKEFVLWKGLCLVFLIQYSDLFSAIDVSS
jgi:hypothetical protein